MNDTGGHVVYPWVTHRNPCPMNLYFLNSQGLKVSVSQVVDL